MVKDKITSSVITGNWLAISDRFELIYDGCIDSSFVPQINYHFYVEMALSGCKHLCETVHDVTCTLLTFVPLQRSCILQEIPWLYNKPDCILAEVYHRHRRARMYVEVFMHEIICPYIRYQTSVVCVIRTWQSYCFHRIPHHFMQFWGYGWWKVQLWAE